MTRRLRKPIIALASLAALATALAFMFVPGGADQSLTVTAQFEDSVGLYEGNAVSVLGMPVGKVTSIVPRSGFVDVTMSIDKNVNIPADVQAVTVNTSLLTDRHIELTPAYRSGPTLKTGDVLGLARTRTPVEFDRTLAMIDKLGVALDGNGQGQGPLADLIAVGHDMTSGNGTNIRQTLDKLSQALRLGADHGAATKSDIQSIVTNLDELTRAAAENDSSIREFGSNLRQISDILADEQIGTGDTGKKLNEVLATATSLLNDNRDRLKGTVIDATTITTAMVDYRRELSETFDLTPMLADNVYNAIDSNAGSLRAKALMDKFLLDGQMAKELCNLAGAKQLGCATGKLSDYAPDFGLNMMLDLMTGAKP